MVYFRGNPFPDKPSREPPEREAFERLKAELTRAFAAPDDTYQPLAASEVIEKNRQRQRASRQE